MSTIGHLFLRRGTAWCYGLTTGGADLPMAFFADVGPHVPSDPQAAFRAFLAWRAQGASPRPLLKYPTRHADGLPFTWDAGAVGASDDPAVLRDLLQVVDAAATKVLVAAHATDAPTADVDAYLVGYGHASATLYVDLDRRRTFVVTHPDLLVYPLRDTAEYRRAMTPGFTTTLPPLDADGRRPPAPDGPALPPTHDQMEAALRGEAPPINVVVGSIHYLVSPERLSVTSRPRSQTPSGPSPHTPHRHR